MAAAALADPAIDTTPALPRRVIRNAPRIGLSEVTKNNLGTVRKLLSVLLPVVYSERFYDDMLDEASNPYCLLLYYGDIPVGLLTCRIERIADTNDARLYIATIGVLAPYRRLGLGTRLFDGIVDRARASWTPPVATEARPTAHPASEDKKKKGHGAGAKAAVRPAPAPAPPPRIIGLKAHVQTSNETARAFWERKHFTLTETLETYYTRVEPKSAWVMELPIAPLETTMS